MTSRRSAGTVLFLGGSGVISAACVERAHRDGFEVTVLNRGRSSLRPCPRGVERLRADVRDPHAVREALRGREFDVVAEFLAFTPEHVLADLELFEGRVRQYLFVGSASAYRKPPVTLPVTESTPLRNPYLPYARDKIACEDVLVRAWRERGFPATVVRPAHTYDRTAIPTIGGWTDIDRMLRGAPVIVHGDGTSLWTITHVRDFAVAFTGLFGRPEAIGEAYHIVSGEALTWDGIYRELARAAGVEPTLVHVPSETIARLLPQVGPSLLGDKMHSMLYDTSKIRAIVPELRLGVPFSSGAREMIRWHRDDPSRQVVDVELDRAFDRLAAAVA